MDFGLFAAIASMLLVAVFLVLSSYIRVPANMGLVLNWRVPQLPILKDLLGLIGLPVKPMKDNQIVALSDEQGGWTAKHWPAGGYLIPLVRLFADIHLFPTKVVAENEVGIVTAIDGKLRDPGINYPKPLDDIDFSDGEGFIRKGGQRGVQLQTLGPGNHLINPKLFEVKNAPRIDIVPEILKDDPYNPGHSTDTAWPMIGLVEVLIGKAIPENQKRILAKSVKGHENFQKLDAFVAKNGEQGLQKDILEPGAFRLNTDYINVKFEAVTRVRPGWVIVQISSEGDEPGDKDYMEPTELGNRKPVKVLKKGITGKRGTLQDVLGPGDWFINPRKIRRILVYTGPQTLRWHEERKDGDQQPLRQLNPFPVESRESYRFSLLGELVIRVLGDDAPMMSALAEGGVEKLLPIIESITAQVVHRICRKHNILDFLHDEGKGIAEEITKNVTKLLRPYYITVEGFQVLDLDYTGRGDAQLVEFLKQLTEQSIAAQRELANKAAIPAELARIELEAKRALADNQLIPARTELVEKALGLSSADFATQPWYIKLFILALMDPEKLSRLIRGK